MTTGPTPDDRAFWIRLALTSALVALPLAYGLVVLDVSPVVTLVVSVVAAVSLLAIWDATRHVPAGWMFWARPEPIQDAETGVFNPGAWRRHLEMEEDRCRRYELDATVIAIRVRGDEPVPAAVAAGLSDACRAHDIVACIDERTYAILAVGTDRSRSAPMIRRIEATIGELGVHAGVSAADRATSGSLPQAWATVALETTV